MSVVRIHGSSSSSRSNGTDSWISSSAVR
uniref:SHL2 n=1 Tax=Arundo donax TaxID=35708 RepID=A0A0A8ZTS6_ARUDO